MTKSVPGRLLVLSIAALLLWGTVPGTSAAQADGPSPQASPSLLSAGVTVEHDRAYGTSGLGVTVDADVARGLGAGASATRFFGRSVEQNTAFTAAQFDRGGWSTSLWLRAPLLTRDGARLYATVGAFHDRVHEEGTLTVYNDAPPYGVIEQRIDRTRRRTGGRVGAGAAYRFEQAGGLALFARPTLLLAPSASMRLVAGARFPLW